MANLLPPLEPIVEGYSIEVEKRAESLFLLHITHDGERRYLLGHEISQPEAVRAQALFSAACEFVNAGGDLAWMLGDLKTLADFLVPRVTDPLVHYEAELRVSRIHRRPDGKYLRVEPDFSEVMTEQELVEHLEEVEGDDESEDLA